MSIRPISFNRFKEPIISTINKAGELGGKIKLVASFARENWDITPHYVGSAFSLHYTGFGNFLKLTFLKGDVSRAMKFLEKTHFLMKNFVFIEGDGNRSVTVAQQGGNAEIELLKTERADVVKGRDFLEDEINKKLAPLYEQFKQNTIPQDEWPGRINQYISGDPQLVADQKMYDECETRIKEIDREIAAKIEELENKKSPQDEFNEIAQMLGAKRIEIMGQIESMVHAKDIKEDRGNKLRSAADAKLRDAEKETQAANTYLKYENWTMFDAKIALIRSLLAEAENVLNLEDSKTDSVPPTPVPGVKQPPLPPFDSQQATKPDERHMPPTGDVPLLGDAAALDQADITTVPGAAADQHEKKFSLPVSEETLRLLTFWQEKFSQSSADETFKHQVTIMKMLLDHLDAYTKMGHINLSGGVVFALTMLRGRMDTLTSSHEVFKVVSNLLKETDSTKLILRIKDIVQKEERFKKDLLELLQLMASEEKLAGIPGLSEAINNLQENPDNITIGPVRELILSIPSMMDEQEDLSVKVDQLAIVINFIEKFEEAEDGKARTELFNQTMSEISAPLVVSLFNAIYKILLERKRDEKQIRELAAKAEGADTEKDDEITALQKEIDNLKNSDEEKKKFFNEYVKYIKETLFVENQYSLDQFIDLRKNGHELKEIVKMSEEGESVSENSDEDEEA
jgi:hypothetical protein